jgi:hypothetical protein
VINKGFTKVCSLIRSYLKSTIGPSYIEVDSGSKNFWPLFVIEPRTLKQCFDDGLECLS